MVPGASGKQHQHGENLQSACQHIRRQHQLGQNAVAAVVAGGTHRFQTGTNVSAVLACFNNIGPGLEAVGPTCNFSQYSDLSKLVLSWAMLAGRLEIFPILVLFSRDTWKGR